jgi:hypothetical protein
MGSVVRAIAGAALAIVGVFTGNPYLIAGGIALLTSSVLGAPKPAANTVTATRLSKILDPEANRKIVFGNTAAPMDVRYWESYGADDNGYVEISACATHKITSFGATYFNNLLAIDAGGSTQSPYIDSVTRTCISQGVSGSGTVEGTAGLWTAHSSMTGCAYVILNWTYNQAKLPQGIPSRYTQVVEGAPLYDPRRDISLGGTHDVTDQTTWQYSPTDSNGKPIGRNNALQVLWYIIGWRINGFLVAGRGVDPSDVDFASFIQAANDCESAGWYSDCVLSTGDSHDNNEGILAAAAGGHLLDTGGMYSYMVTVDDTANIAAYLTDDDIVSGVSWTPRETIDSQYNVVSGTFVDPAVLYQPRPYISASETAYVSALGFRKSLVLNFQAVQDPTQAYKLAHLVLNRGQRQGVFQATFNYRAFQARNWNVVSLTFSRYGWVNKLFRITQQSLAPDGGIVMTMLEEDATIYLGGTVQIPGTPGTSSVDDPRHKIAVAGLSAVNISKVSANGLSTFDGLRIYWTRPSSMVHHTEVQYQQSTDTLWTSAAPVLLGASQLDSTHDCVDVSPLVTGTLFNVRARHVSIFDVPGDWYTTTGTTGSTTQFDQSLVGVGGTSTATLLAALQSGQDLLAQLVLSQETRFLEIKKYFEGLTYVGEVPVNATVITNQTNQTTTNTAVASSITFIGAQVSTAQAAILTESTARASADSAEATARTTLAATVGANTAAITTEQTTRATADTALSTSITGLTSTVGGNTAAIASEAVTRAWGDSANASSISTVSTTVSGLSASVTTLNTSVAGLSAESTLVVSGSGYISGWTASAGALGGVLKFIANDFYFVDPASGSNLVAAAYSGGNWYLSGTLQVQAIKTNTIVANHIVSNEIARTTRTVNTPSTSVASSYVSVGTHTTTLSGGPTDIDVWTNIQNATGGSIGVKYYMTVSTGGSVVYTSRTWGMYTFDGINGAYNSTTFVDRWTPSSVATYTFEIFAARGGGSSTLTCDYNIITVTDNKVQS